MDSIELDVFKRKDVSVVWQPQEGPQTALIACPIFEIFFGGARGGGKTEASIGDWIAHSNLYGENAVGLFVRRKFVQLQEVIARTKQIFSKIGAKYNAQEHVWTMSNGARLKFAYLEKDTDAEEYQGHNYTRIYIEEVTNFPSPAPINKLRATLRSAANVPVGMRLTGNPGGAGHNWVKKRYIDPDSRGFKVIRETDVIEIDGNFVEISLERVFIPSKLVDNKLLMRHDPTYVLRLKQSGSAELVKAWLEGDWSIIDGAFFDCFDTTKHVLPQSFIKEIPIYAPRFRAFDWGSAKPFSVGWYAISDGKWGLPKEALIKYREWYGAKGDNIGLKMTSGMVAQGIIKREKGEHMQYGVADPAIYIRDGGPSIGEEMAKEGCTWRRADNKRIPGWEQLRLRLVGQNDVPMLYFLENCVDTIRTIPVLQHDDKDMEDLDTEGEDHAADETRYAAMSRPWIPEPIKVMTKSSNNILDMTLNDIIENRRKQRLARAYE